MNKNEYDRMIKEHLKNLSINNSIPNDHVLYLKKLKDEGFEPKVIYDIGSCVLNWVKEAKKLWPTAKYILFDAYDKVEFLYKDYDYHIGVLSDKDNKFVKFYQSDEHPGGNSYYKEVGSNLSNNIFTEEKAVYKLCKTLDTVVREKGFPSPDLIKMDVQGSEMDIIKGGRNTISKCEHLIVELQDSIYNLGAPLADKTLPYIESLG